jgi:hypothetical protein
MYYYWLYFSCVDSILINGRGAVHCLSADEIASYETPYLKGAIDNLSLTDKVYVKVKEYKKTLLTFLIQMLP